MSRWERTGIRDLTYSRWHRSLDDNLTAVDVDFVEYCSACGEPLALLETTRDDGRNSKPTSVLRALARRANMPAYLLFYSASPAGAVTCFRLRQVWPQWSALSSLTPGEFRAWLQRLREQHACARTPVGVC